MNSLKPRFLLRLLQIVFCLISSPFANAADIVPDNYNADLPKYLTWLKDYIEADFRNRSFEFEGIKSVEIRTEEGKSTNTYTFQEGSIQFNGDEFQVIRYMHFGETKLAPSNSYCW